jgi:G3E family GTPase
MNRPAEGMRHVLVNGQPVIADGVWTRPPGRGAPAARSADACPFLSSSSPDFSGPARPHSSTSCWRSEGRRISAVVNDFGAINIDAELIAGNATAWSTCQWLYLLHAGGRPAADALEPAAAAEPRPEAIVIETSGVSDPAEIVRNLMDPVIWRDAPLETVLCVLDAEALADRPTLPEDALWLSQLRAGDFLVLNKADAVSPATLGGLREQLGKLAPGRTVLVAHHGEVPAGLFFTEEPADMPDRAAPNVSRFSTPNFESVSWTSDRPLSLPRFQAALSRLAPDLVRAKGILRFEGQEKPMLFQMVGQRATFGAAPPVPEGAAPVRLVLIAEIGRLRAEVARAMLEDCRA